ncbi:hypothetical protein R3P38DRAFT_2803574 [Favolaschia claudopus]|uniref:Uncharacterized protein n=1 Tax=Favolaschia claudopus TaxID=2862362 RepID=A0AAV9ZSV1_9AGAR
MSYQESHTSWLTVLAMLPVQQSFKVSCGFGVVGQSVGESALEQVRLPDLVEFSRSNCPQTLLIIPVEAARLTARCGVEVFRHYHHPYGLSAPCTPMGSPCSIFSACAIETHDFMEQPGLRCFLPKYLELPPLTRDTFSRILVHPSRVYFIRFDLPRSKLDTRYTLLAAFDDSVSVLVVKRGKLFKKHKRLPSRSNPPSFPRWHQLLFIYLLLDRRSSSYTPIAVMSHSPQPPASACLTTRSVNAPPPLPPNGPRRSRRRARLRTLLKSHPAVSASSAAIDVQAELFVVQALLDAKQRKGSAAAAAATLSASTTATVESGNGGAYTYAACCCTRLGGFRCLCAAEEEVESELPLLPPVSAAGGENTYDGWTRVGLALALTGEGRRSKSAGMRREAADHQPGTEEDEGSHDDPFTDAEVQAALRAVEEADGMERERARGEGGWGEWGEGAGWGGGGVRVRCRARGIEEVLGGAEWNSGRHHSSKETKSDETRDPGVHMCMHLVSTGDIAMIVALRRS